MGKYVQSLFSVLASILAFSFSLLAFFGAAEAQISSAAFDPNCYFPGIGIPGEIDTIYGSHGDQYLGSGMTNIGPAPGDPYGRISCLFDHIYSIPKDIWKDSLFTTGSAFNLHKLHVIADFNIFNIIRRGHFRSPKYSDILSYNLDQTPARIYWQDDNGDYDSSRYTQLYSSKKGKWYDDYSFMVPYSAHISSDTAEDIIYRVMSADADTIPAYFNLLYYKGGQQLFDQGKIAFEDSSLFGEYASSYKSIGGTNQGDFRGIGREDLLISDHSGDFLYYKNDPPFSMASFIHSLRYDTLLRNGRIQIP